MITVKEVVSKKDKKAFAKYPVQLYDGCKYYVPSLRSDEINTFNPQKNFSLEGNDIKGFLAYKDGKLAGRILAIINRKDNEITGKNYVRFSRFECVDDIEVFKALLSAVAAYGKENGMEIMHGPWGFNDTDREGMLTYGFDARATYSTNYYYPYFSENMVKLGFEDESKWLERKFVIQHSPKMYELGEKLKKRYNFKDVADTMSIKKIIKLYGEKLFDTLNDAYGSLDGYVPITDKVISNVLKQFATIANLRYVSILVDDEDEVAGFAIVLPSIADALVKSRGKLLPFGFIGVLKSILKPKQLEMALIGVKHKYKNSGINAIMISKILKNIVDDGVTLLESNPMLETNYSIQQQWKFTDNEVWKKRQTYKADIDVILKNFNG